MAWRIPDGTVIPANGYLLFYASGNNTGLHTSFRLAAEGEEAVLSNRLGQVLSIAEYDILDENQAYSRRADGSYTDGFGRLRRARRMNKAFRDQYGPPLEVFPALRLNFQGE